MICGRAKYACGICTIWRGKRSGSSNGVHVDLRKECGCSQLGKEMEQEGAYKLLLAIIIGLLTVTVR